MVCPCKWSTYLLSGYRRGPAVILVHGNGEDHTIFDETAALLSRDYTVYAIDSRGHGKSSFVENIHYQEMADDVAALIEKLEIRKPVYCGFSDGGILGLLIACQHPELHVRPDLLRRQCLSGGDEEAVASAVFPYSRFDKDPKIRMMVTEPQISENELEQITVPTLVLAGQHDMISEDHTRFLASKIRGSRLKIVPGENHGSYIVHSRKLYYLIKDFLREMDEKRSV